MSKGYVYILTNPCIRSLRGKPVVKVGFTNNMPRRLGCLNTSVPENFRVAVLFELENYRGVELWSKSYIGDSLKTSDGSSTEFFEKSVEEIKEQIIKCCRHHNIRPVRCDGSIYVGRSSSAIRNNLENPMVARAKKAATRPIGRFESKAQLGRYILALAGKAGKTNGYVMNILRKQNPCPKSSKWRKIFDSVGVKFNARDFVSCLPIAKAG